MSEKIRSVCGLELDSEKLEELQVICTLCACDCNPDVNSTIQGVCPTCKKVLLKNKSYRYLEGISYFHCQICQNFCGDTQCCCEICFSRVVDFEFPKPLENEPTSFLNVLKSDQNLQVEDVSSSSSYFREKVDRKRSITIDKDDDDNICEKKKIIEISDDDEDNKENQTPNTDI